MSEFSKEREVSLVAQHYRKYPAAVRARGEKLVDAVSSPEDLGDGPPWHLIVFGTQPYSVIVGAKGGSICTCPAYRQKRACKHLWAAFLSIDRLRSGEGSTQASASRPMPRAERRTTKRGRKPAKKVPPPKPSPPPVQWDEERLNRVLQLRRKKRVREVQLLDHVGGELHFFLLGGIRRGTITNAILAGFRSRLANGHWGSTSVVDLGDRFGPEPSHDDRLRLGRIHAYRLNYGNEEDPVTLPDEVAAEIVLDLAATGRLYVTDRLTLVGVNDKNTHRVTVDAGTELQVATRIAEPGPGAAALECTMSLDGEPVGRERIRAFIGREHVVIDDRLVRWVGDVPPEVCADLIRAGALHAPLDHVAALRELVEDVEVPKAPAPVPILWLRESVLEKSARVLLRGELGFRYGDEECLASMREGSVTIDGVSYRRDESAERAAVDAFTRCGGVLHSEFDEPVASVPAKATLAVVPALIDEGFEVYAANERVRSAPTPSFSVASGVDWFEVEVEVKTSDGHAVPVPKLLEALQNGGGGFVRVSVGEVALIGGAAGLDGLRALRRLGKSVGGKLRFPKAQGFLLDAMLSARRAEVSVDEGFAAVRSKAKQGLSVKPAREPKGFGAELRPYQRDGLGWFRFLGELGVGGCLADDMGLGKTVQVLALLEQQRRRRPKPGPSLVVAPRSLVFHWEREAARFAPKLRVLAFVGQGRFDAHEASFECGFADRDLVLTTYGTLRNDIDRLQECEWNYVVLDESQAIKNERSLASKAVRLCRAQHRLALSGTPIENHLGELWSLFEFLNPGMLGGSKAFRDLVQSTASGTKPRSGPQSEEVEESVTGAVRDAVRPFLLRRTKAQVLTDLPEKTEQLLDCELSAGQRASYDELAKHYRARLLGEIDESKIPEKIRFQVLEALLRLRQAACHPGLLDPARAGESCAKFDALLPMLDEIRESGNKALVFSQFPSFLKLLRPRLEAAGHEYAYLDGQTSKRQQQVDRFQEEVDCGLFLISIKAGGHGLNLTAANYVFVLDPWWNPAVEAQAVDRAHRIGQTQSVSAYRLICRGTVEERVTELQQRKRSLVEAVLGDDRSVLQDLTAADVAALLA